MRHRPTPASAEHAAPPKRRKSAHGGARPGAGRPKLPGSGVPHRTRPELYRHHPVHVTLRVARGVYNLRSRRSLRCIRWAFARAQLRQDRPFRFTHYSVQGNHLHLICEAENKAALRTAITGLCVRIARALNQMMDREGQRQSKDRRIFPGRYHARALKTPLQVRRALLYVLNNFRRHQAQVGKRLPPAFIDPFSSAAVFDGWRTRPRPERDPCPRYPVGVDPPTRYLLTHAWRRHGTLRTDEMPGARALRSAIQRDGAARGPARHQRPTRRHDI